VEAEDFDPGGYSDTSEGNEGGAYRTDVDVDIKALGTGYAVGWMTVGEWLEYTVNVPVAGDYTLDVRAGAVDAGRTLELSECGTALVDPVAIPQIAAWGEMATTTAGTVHLEAGVQVIRVTVGPSDYVDFDSFTLVQDDTGTPGSGGAGGSGTAAAGGVGGAGDGAGGVVGTIGGGGGGANDVGGATGGDAASAGAEPGSSSGCSCTLASRPRTSAMPLFACAVALVTARRRKKRQRAHASMAAKRLVGILVSCLALGCNSENKATSTAW
jgi:hypothetical protein